MADRARATETMTVVALDEIEAKWWSLGGPAEWIPLGDAAPCANGSGYSRHFVHASHGTLATIHSHARWGAFLMTRQIRDKWYELGGEHSVLGCPASDEQSCDDGRGRFTEFRRPNGPEPHADTDATDTAADTDATDTDADADAALIICGPNGEPHEVHGAIATKWRRAGFVERVGYPVTDEFLCADGVGRFYQFHAARRSRIYATPRSGVHLVADPIYTAWLATGLEVGVLGYPVSDQEQRSGRLAVRFERGQITWSPRDGFQVELAAETASGRQLHRTEGSPRRPWPPDPSTAGCDQMIPGGSGP